MMAYGLRRAVALDRGYACKSIHLFDIRWAGSRKAATGPQVGESLQPLPNLLHLEKDDQTYLRAGANG